MKDVVREEQQTVVIRFAGDSGDGMQLTGKQFTHTSAVLGNDVHTFPDFPAEIRAPAGSLHGVSGFQLSFSELDIHTPGDSLDILVAMNPAALKVNINDLNKGGLLLCDSDKFIKRDWEKAGYTENPLEDKELDNYRVVKAPITDLTLRSLEEFSLSRAKARKCKNMFALGIVFWLYNRPLEPTIEQIKSKYADSEDIVNANIKALKTGYNFAITAELFTQHYDVKEASLPPGHYRQITGNEAIALACAVAAKKSGKQLLATGYPITPSSDILHFLSNYASLGVKTFQAEDEMGAIGAAIGGSYAGHLAVTCTSGPGMDLKGEFLGLSVMSELPLAVVNVQRAGPSTGMPTKVEQADLFLALHGRHGECPIPVLAPSSPGRCFYILLEAYKIAVKYMTPVIVLSDAYLAGGAEPWMIPDLNDIDDIELDQISNDKKDIDNISFNPYQRNANLARPWVVPGTLGFEHVIGGLEKEDITGKISYSPENHQLMVDKRREKVEGIAKDYPALAVNGNGEGDLLIITWGSNLGVVQTAVGVLQNKGIKISFVALEHLYPLPQDLSSILNSFKRAAVVELNSGQLCSVLRDKYLKDIKSISKTTGKPFKVDELIKAILQLEV